MRFVFVSIAIFLVGLVPFSGEARTEELNEVVRAEVLQILDEEERLIVGTDATATIQSLRILFLEGERAGETAVFENELVSLQQGDVFFMHRLVTVNDEEFLLYKDVDRRGSLVALAFVAVGLMVWFARMQGVRAIASLLLSVGAILFVLVPLLLAGYPPVWTSFMVAVGVLGISFFGTHGIKPHVVVAFFGTMSAVGLTCILATFWVSTMRLSGFGDDASVYLNFATDGRLDFSGLLLGAIIIGILGVLDDVSITQAAVVRQLKAVNPALSVRELYERALSVGRDHVASLVNTLALAYVGVALPLVLFLSTSEAPIGQLLNQELVAAELVRIMIGSIGIILAVPITTLAAAWWFGTRGAGEGEAATPACAHQHPH